MISHREETQSDKRFGEPVGLPGLRRLRQAQNRSMEDLAREIGVGVNTVWRWENGKADASDPYKRHLCAIFECTPNDLMLPPDPEATITHLDGHQVENLEPAEAPAESEVTRL